MIVYSDTLDEMDLRRACIGITAVYLTHNVVGSVPLVEGPRVRARRFERVTLRANSAERMPDWREMDGGADGRAPQYATYHEYGRWMAALLDVDPNARIKSALNDFRGREDFHAQTGGLYAAGVKR